MCRVKKIFKCKNLFLVTFLAIAGFFSAGAFVINKQVNETPVVEKADAAISKTVTRVYIEDQVTTTPVLAIESISFASGYGHDQWRSFLTSYLGARSTYTTTSGTSMPSKKGWSYMSNTEQEKYLLCPTGSKNFTMVFPEWVTAFSYKAVGNNWWNWFDVNGSAVGVHSGWGIGKKINSYIYNDSGWKMNANLDNTAQTNTWGDITITANAILSGTTTQLASKSITMSKYYKISSETYNLFGYIFGGWYTTNALTIEHTALLTANATVYAKQTLNKEAYISGTMNNWATSDDNYLLAPGSDSQYTITINLNRGDEFKIVYQGTNWYGWSQVDGDSVPSIRASIIEGSNPDSMGARIKVDHTGSYTIYFKTTEVSNKIWIERSYDDEIYLTGSMNDWNRYNPSYKLSRTETVDPIEYVIILDLEKDAEFKIVFEGYVWDGWSKVDGSSKTITDGAIVQGSDPDGTGNRIKAAKAGKYEIYYKSNWEYNKIWIQYDSETEAILYAEDFLTTITCTGQGSISFNINDWNKVGAATTSMEYKYEQLTVGAKGKLALATPSIRGNEIEQCAARYDAILSKYGYGTGSGQYHDFMGRTPSRSSSAIRSFSPFSMINGEDGGDNATTIIIIIASSISLLSITALSVLLVKKRKAKQE